MKVELQQFDPGNPALTYIENRITDDNYRGAISSQHNRWTFDDLLFVLERLDYYSRSNQFLAIRTTDKSKRPQNVVAEFDFAHFCDEVTKKLGKGSQDAMRKNWFVDWHRAGWIERYNTDQFRLDPYVRGSTAFVRVSIEGRKLIDPNRSLEDKYFVFSKGINELYQGTIDVLLYLFRESQIGWVDAQEFTFFITGIDSPEAFGITRDAAMDLISAWRRMTSMTRRQINVYLSTKLVKDESIKTKTKQRDFHNWLNKTEQSFSLLKQTIYFEQRNSLKYSYLNRLYYLGDTAIEETGFAISTKKLKRNLQQKHDYFKEHSISKITGFELHHIVALAWAESQHEFKLLDDWRNMIYIDAFSHSKITQNGNRQILLEATSDSELSLSDYDGNVLGLKRPENAEFSIGKLPIMLEYNAQLCRSRERKN